MTQIAFLRKADQPTNGQIQDIIQKLGYDFKILSGLEKQIDQDGLECSINGHQTYFETYIEIADDAIMDNEADWIKPDITNQDTAISFVWGADFVAGACIGLISIALIDQSGALVYYMDDQMKYTRELLLEETPQYLAELDKQDSKNEIHQEPINPKPTNMQTKNTFLQRLKNIFK
ncbi:hypothetical protein A5893_17420 [Pedobacter psychrophilus]|uniref:Uncharacterized protein n=1 Tax=Pedobacter psychrophilus TaxID=1826909 RepID=A0A179DHV7_9SPHI|nr:hypothetical protein [Pedobacter psychrophilus]OAQ40013.1 hypothetical protein A5893_17420 [Pedobacter psychrophilus]